MKHNLLKVSATERSVLLYLGSEGIFIGAALALLYVTANALFLTDFGSETLPYVFIAVAIFASLTFYGISELQRRWTVGRVVIASLIILTAMLFAARLILTQPNTNWVSFALMVSFIFGGQLALVSVGVQAGRLLNIRQMKRLFPIMMGIFNVGFIASSLSVSALLPILTTTEDLLLVAGSYMLVALTISVVVVRRFALQFGHPPQQESWQAPQSKSLPQLLRNRYVTSIFTYQFFSASGTQLVLFLLITLADMRYNNPDDLARFFGNFGAARNILNVLFMVLLAGQLMNRFGLSFGLTANPIAVGVVTVLIIVVNVAIGQGSLLFWLTVAAVTLDVIFSEAITGTSLKAAYQALPATQRPVVEAGVEGIGVPLAIGLTGILLILFNAIPGLTFTHIILFTIFVIGLWIASALLAYRDYARTLLKTLSRRALGPEALSLVDESSLKAIETLLHRDHLPDVRLGLDMLAEAEHASLPAHLVKLANHADPEIRAEVLARIEQERVEAALPSVGTRLQKETNPACKGAALRAFCALSEGEAVEAVIPYLDDPEPAVRLGATVGLLRYGGIPGVLAAGERLTKLERAADPSERTFVARVIGEVKTPNFYQPLLSLLADDDVAVRRAALDAAGKVGHPRLLPLVVANLAGSATRSAAMSALTASGEVVLPLVAQALAGKGRYDTETVRRLVRVSGQIKGERVIKLLKQYLNHPNPSLQHQMLSALHLCGYRASEKDQPQIEQALQGCLQQGAWALLAKQDIGEAKALIPLHAALDYEFSQARRRVFLLLSFIYEPRAMLRAEERLARGSSAERAIAIETLDVALPNKQKGLILPLIDDGMPMSRRVQTLAQEYSLLGMGREARLREIITDAQGWMDSWTRACAAYAGGHLALKDLVEAIEGALEVTTPPVRETAAWALHELAVDIYRHHVAELSADPNPQVAQLISHLTG